MNKREAKRKAIGILMDLVYMECYSPTGLTTDALKDSKDLERDALRLQDAMDALYLEMENRLSRKPKK